MDAMETTDQFTIVNRSMEHRISKKLIRKVPYFDRMLSHDLLESKENKVILDLDEQAFKLILDWLEFGFIHIEMDNVVKLCTIGDYFGINNYLVDDCISHFHDNFSIEHLPVLIPQVTETSACINSGTLNVFICRYFTKIANTTFWLNYPVETIEYICALNLMIHAEVQVFDAIMKWVHFKADSRKCYLKGLLKLVRWCHFEDKDLIKIKENEFYKSSDFDLISHLIGEKKCYCQSNRTQQNYFIAIEELNATDLRVKVLESNFMPLISLVVQPDESMPLDVLHNEHVSDIFFDSGKKMIRIDWKQAKYRLIEYKSHYHKIHKCLFEDQKSEEYSIFNNRKENVSTRGLLLEANDKFVLVRDYNYCCFCWTIPTTKNINDHFCDYGTKDLATVLENNIYMIKDDFEFIQLTIDGKPEYKSMEIEKLKDLNFNNLLLTSTQANDDRVIIIDKSTKALFCYNVKTAKWSSMGRISNCDNRSADGQRESDKLIAFTSTFLSINAIKLCINLNSNK